LSTELNIKNNYHMKKISKDSEPKKTKKVHYEPTEEEIREKALEIFYQRTDRGEEGTALNDWLLAEAWLKE